MIHTLWKRRITHHHHHHHHHHKPAINVLPSPVGSTISVLCVTQRCQQESSDGAKLKLQTTNHKEDRLYLHQVQLVLPDGQMLRVF